MNKTCFCGAVAGGEGRGCPGGKRRSTAITFACGMDDKITRLAETETCRYAVDWTTPAACVEEGAAGTKDGAPSVVVDMGKMHGHDIF